MDRHKAYSRQAFLLAFDSLDRPEGTGSPDSGEAP